MTAYEHLKQLGSVLVTGAGGQLGRELVELLRSEGVQVYGLTRAELDITDSEAVRQWVDSYRPGAIVHAAAYTQVDRAECEADEAFRTNAIGTRNIAVAAQSAGARLVYVSTDYVFDGTRKTPYNEWCETGPLNVYGRSKLAGEAFVRELHSRFFIVRTSWVYGPYGHNFVKTMLRLGQEGKELRVVNDQFGAPTNTLDLSRAIAALLMTEKYGLYHVSNSGQCSWYEFACEIFNLAGIDAKITPIATETLQQQAKRPSYSVLEPMMLRLNDFPPLPAWQQALKRYVEHNPGTMLG